MRLIEKEGDRQKSGKAETKNQDRKTARNSETDSEKKTRKTEEDRERENIVVLLKKLELSRQTSGP